MLLLFSFLRNHNIVRNHNIFCINKYFVLFRISYPYVFRVTHISCVFSQFSIYSYLHIYLFPTFFPSFFPTWSSLSTLRFFFFPIPFSLLFFYLYLFLSIYCFRVEEQSLTIFYLRQKLLKFVPWVVLFLRQMGRYIFAREVFMEIARQWIGRKHEGE